MSHSPKQATPSHQLMTCLHTIIQSLVIPADAKRIAINFRRSEYYQTREGYPPVEVQLEKQNQAWHIVFIASFAYPDEKAQELEVTLYFNFLRGWFYQPDIERCDLHQPEVFQLYQTWEPMLLNQIHQQHFDAITATLVSSQQA